MQNNKRNKLFLDLVGEDAKAEIVGSIANHYGTDPESIIEELMDDEAEHLLEYMIEPHRSVTSSLMLRHNLRGF